MIWFIIVGAIFITAGISRLFSDFLISIVVILIGLGLIFWGLRKKLLPKVFSSAKDNDPQHQSSSSPLITESFSLVGVNYYTENIEKLACKNPLWNTTVAAASAKDLVGKPIYRYNYVNKPVKLIPEPNNPNDKNAVAVYFAGELVGYISRDDNQRILDILNNRSIKYISGFIGGGDYKIITAEGKIIKETEHNSVRVKIGYV